MLPILLLAAGLQVAPAAMANAQSDKEMSGCAVPLVSHGGPLTADALVRLRDIGPTGLSQVDDHVLSVSPDGRRVAFQLRQADPVANRYTFSLCVDELGTTDAVSQLDQGGDFIQTPYAAQGFAAYTADGSPMVVTPEWSPDGAHVAYLRRDSGRTRVWVANANGSGAAPMNDLEYDADEVAWSADGLALIIAGRPDLPVEEKKLDEEGRSGWVFDDRFIPAVGPRPLVRSEVATKFMTLDIRTNAVRPSSPVEVARLLDPTEGPPSSLKFASSKGGDLAWTSKRKPAIMNSGTVLHVRERSGRVDDCDANECDGVIALWWTLDGKRVVYLRRGGWARSENQLYTWRPGRPPSLLVSTADLIAGCEMAARQLVCVREGKTAPRRIVGIDVETGGARTIYDPNPGFASYRLGKVERLTWRNVFGVESFGDLVYPTDYVPGHRYPMVVVGYESRGFLRGGTGDEYPIQVFANHGFAVLSFQRPLSLAYGRGSASADDMNRADISQWSDRQSVQSSLSIGVGMVVDMGIADPARVGITGLSDGASTAEYALINSSIFKAAALSTCCQSTSGVSVAAGAVMARRFYRYGYPKYMQPDPSFWGPVSLRQNLDRIKTPILLQLSDDEYQFALEDFVSLREAGKPVEMVIFPDERHIKWQPSHRLAAYDRAVDWFAFWLQDACGPLSDEVAQCERWRKLASTPTH